MIGGKSVTLRLFREQFATSELGESIVDQIEAGIPDPAFRWPLDVFEVSGGEPAWGFIYPAHPTSWVLARELISNPAKYNLRIFTAAARHLAIAFGQLNRAGYSLRDFSFTDLSIDPLSGEIGLDVAERLIADQDPRAVPAEIPRFLAPELVRREVFPSSSTDRHLLSTIIFVLLLAAHPLEGIAVRGLTHLDASTARRLYGERPRYIFDENKNNEPAPSALCAQLEPCLPRFLREEFKRAFTKGLQNPNERQTPDAWSVILTRLYDCIFPCPSCQGWNIWRGVQNAPPNTGITLQCPLCQRPSAPPLRLQFPQNKFLMLHKECQLFTFHTLSEASRDFRNATARVDMLPNLPGHLGLRNETATTWAYSETEGGRLILAPKGRFVPLALQTRINFGPFAGTIVV